MHKKVIDVQHKTSSPGKYSFPANMRPVSGGSGSYEEACRTMLIAALRWLDDNPGAQIRFKDFGVERTELSEDEKIILGAINAAKSGTSRTMLTLVIKTIMRVKEIGWGKYLEEMSG